MGCETMTLTSHGERDRKRWWCQYGRALVEEIARPHAADPDADDTGQWSCPATDRRLHQFLVPQEMVQEIVHEDDHKEET